MKLSGFIILQKILFMSEMVYASKLGESMGNKTLSYEIISKVYQGLIYELLNISMTTWRLFICLLKLQMIVKDKNEAWQVIFRYKIEVYSFEY